MTNRAKTAEDIFDKQQTIHGIDKLKGSISKMPRNTQIVSMKNPWEETSVKGTESVVRPPQETMNEVKRGHSNLHSLDPSSARVASLSDRPLSRQSSKVGAVCVVALVRICAWGDQRMIVPTASFASLSCPAAS